MEFKEKFKQLRKRAGLSQKEIAEKAEINQATISNIESGLTPREIIKVGIGEKIAKALMVPFSELFEVDAHVDFLKMELENENKALKSVLEEEKADNKRLKKNIDLLNSQSEGLKLSLEVKERMLVVLFNKLANTDRKSPLKITGAELQNEAFKQLQKEFPEIYGDKVYNPFTGAYETKKNS